MITDAILGALSWVLDRLAGLLPDGSDFLPSWSLDLSAQAAKAGPLNKFLPVEEVFTALDLMWSYYLPVMVVYSTVKWVYRHLPVIGKG